MCLANTTIQPSNSNQMGFLGQASFDYINTLSASTFYAAVADYQGSHLCKAAPSEGVLLVWLSHSFVTSMRPEGPMSLCQMTPGIRSYQSIPLSGMVSCMAILLSCAGARCIMTSYSMQEMLKNKHIAN